MDSPSGLVWSARDAKGKKPAVMGNDDFAANVVVLNLDLRSENDKKKVMKAVSSLSGVDSISLNMKENKLTVTGNFDPVKLVLLVRKKCCADIESVGPANEYKPEKEKDELSSASDELFSASEELSSVLENPGMHYSSSSHFSAKRKLEYDSSYMKRFKYDVFISFRVEDPRESFTDYLYEALLSERIVAFRDDVRLERGETVSDQLVKAIEDSWSAVVVLSQEYISSSRCLEELVKLLECREETGLVVLPVFYNVHPFDVRHITGDVEEAFHRFRDDGVDAAKLQRWERALKMVVDFKGWTSAKGHETELVERIVDWISSWLRNLELECLWAKKAQMNKDAGKHLGDLEMSLAKDHVIGIDDQVERITKLMNMGSDHILMIGICGPDGIGKTSLAKAVYNRLSSQFDAHCFLEDIKEEKPIPGGIQSKVVRDILWSDYGGGTSYGEGFEVLKEVLPHMKVLIVLDDLDHVSQIKEVTGVEPHIFGSGSMIIVTTKEDHFCAEDLGEDLPVHYYVQPVSLMNADLALQLFSLHVFGNNSPGPDYCGIAKTIINGLKGYPLLIEVIGSLLHSKEPEEFKELSKRIDPPTLSFSDLLKIGYETLDEIHQQIFLDIACCIANEDVEIAKYMWHDCPNRYPNCILMPLAKLGYHGELWMHSSLRHFGQQMVRAEDKGNSGICSRVFVHQIAIDIMKNGKGTEQVEALCLDFGGHPPEEFTAENFKKMPNLRFLRLDSALIAGELGDVFPKLRWLKWKKCPLDFEATNVRMEELVILDLSRSVWG